MPTDELAIARAKRLARQARDCIHAQEENADRRAIVLLAQAFPSLRNAEGLDPWRPEAFHAWAVRTQQEMRRNSASFVLTLWNAELLGVLDNEAEAVRPLGELIALEAIAEWDQAHRAAFALWASDPWWP